MAEITAAQIAEIEKYPALKVTWDILQEVGRRQAETAAQFEKDRQKQAEAAAQFEERWQKQEERLARLDKLVERLGANVGGLNCSLGDLVETLFAPCLGEKFVAYNYDLKRIFHRVNLYDENIKQRGEIDILLSDTTVCMAVEVKRWLEKKEHVDEHIKRMELIRTYPPAEVKGKTLLGAIVGAVVTPEAREYAEQSGFFVLELTGEDVRLLPPPKDFKPREW